MKTFNGSRLVFRLRIGYIEKMSSPLNFRPTAEIRAELERLAEDRGVSLGVVIRDALDAYFLSPCARCKGTGKEPLQGDSK